MNTVIRVQNSVWSISHWMNRFKKLSNHLLNWTRMQEIGTKFSKKKKLGYIPQVAVHTHASNIDPTSAEAAYCSLPAYSPTSRATHFNFRRFGNRLSRTVMRTEYVPNNKIHHPPWHLTTVYTYYFSLVLPDLFVMASLYHSCTSFCVTVVLCWQWIVDVEMMQHSDLDWKDVVKKEDRKSSTEGVTMFVN